MGSGNTQENNGNMYRGIPQRREKIRYARKLRKRLTIAEELLWSALRGHQLRDLKFRRQAPIGPYIVDFLCVSCRLVIELDGRIHDEQWEYDAAREEQLQKHGYRVIRFANDDVEDNLPEVLERIERFVFPVQPSPRPSPGSSSLREGDGYY